MDTYDTTREERSKHAAGRRRKEQVDGGEW
jgi:hypothetical protein